MDDASYVLVVRHGPKTSECENVTVVSAVIACDVTNCATALHGFNKHLQRFPWDRWSWTTLSSRSNDQTEWGTCCSRPVVKIFNGPRSSCYSGRGFDTDCPTVLTACASPDTTAFIAVLDDSWRISIICAVSSSSWRLSISTSWVDAIATRYPQYHNYQE